MNNKGFTLIELLVSVTIIGLLASISVPYFKFYKYKAAIATAKADVRNIITAQEDYYGQNGRYANCLFPGSCNRNLSLNSGYTSKLRLVTTNVSGFSGSSGTAGSSFVVRARVARPDGALPSTEVQYNSAIGEIVTLYEQ